MSFDSAKSAKQIHESRRKMWETSIAYHQKYLDAQTGLFAEMHTESRPCPVCEGSAHRKLFNKEGGTYVKCKNCDMIFLNPVLKDSALLDFYSNNHNVQSEIVEGDADFYDRIYQTGLSLAQQHVQPLRNLLDIGCSSGYFLNLAAKSGVAATHGIELNKLEAEVAEKRGHKIYRESLEKLTFAEKFDLITLWDVFEHIKAGKKYLKELRSLLSERGLILLQIPNAGALAARMMHQECNMFDGLEHVNLYDPENFRVLAETAGYQVIEMRTVISEIPVMANYLKYEDPYFGEKEASNTLLSIISEDEIHRNLLGYKLQIVLKPV